MPTEEAVFLMLNGIEVSVNECKTVYSKRYAESAYRISCFGRTTSYGRTDDVKCPSRIKHIKTGTGSWDGFASCFVRGKRVQ